MKEEEEGDMWGVSSHNVLKMTHSLSIASRWRRRRRSFAP